MLSCLGFSLCRDTTREPTELFPEAAIMVITNLYLFPEIHFTSFQLYEMPYSRLLPILPQEAPEGVNVC